MSTEGELLAEKLAKLSLRADKLARECLEARAEIAARRALDHYRVCPKCGELTNKPACDSCGAKETK